MTLNMNWDMSSVFQGGSESLAVREKIASIKSELKDHRKMLEEWNSDDGKALKAIIEKYTVIAKGIGQVGTFASGLASADVHDTQALTLTNEVTEIAVSLDALQTILKKKIVEIPDADFEALVSSDEFFNIAFVLKETRRDGKKLLSVEEENLRHALSVDGFYGWGDHYDTIVQKIAVPFENEKGEAVLLSAGQAQNQLEAHPATEVRHQILREWEAAWSNYAPLFADTLNRVAGFRLADQKAHGIDDFLTPPLEYNRMEKETLDTMWATVARNKVPLVDYMTRKAKLLGLDKLTYADWEAPLVVGDFEARRYSFEEARDFIVENFEAFSPKMADVAKRAFDEHWIEAEDRPGKRPGGYCSDLPESGESRIFMTYSGSPNEVATLAHEIGHAFHSDVMRDIPYLNQGYAMNVAETASTFAELIVSDATVKEAASVEEKINLLDDKISRSVAMFMDIHSRFLFEVRFYNERKNGFVSHERLNELMLEAQKEAYADQLSVYHPTFWASKLHFYATDVPFYNFPYTFGFLFSTGIYSRALASDGDFEAEYIALLRDTGAMSTEDLAKKHLNVDLTLPEFWQRAIDLLYEDIDEFMTLTENYL